MRMSKLFGQTLREPPADAQIAAFTEWINADLLISENRHFVRELKPEGFKVLRAKDLIKVLEKSVELEKKSPRKRQLE